MILVQASILATYGWERLYLNLAVLLAVMVVQIIYGFAMFYRKIKKPRYIPLQFCSFIASFCLIITIGPLFLNFVYREAIEMTFAMFMMMAFLTRSFQFKTYAVLIMLSSLLFIAHNYEGVA